VWFEVYSKGRGYRAYGAPGWVEHDGTVAPTAAITSIIFTPDLSQRAAKAIYDRYSARLWGRYGFGNAFSLASMANSTSKHGSPHWAGGFTVRKVGACSFIQNRVRSRC